jgi:xylobiose transport system permease protein
MSRTDLRLPRSGRTGQAPARATARRPARALWARRPNVLGGVGALLWLVVVGLPLYALAAATLQLQNQYLRQGPLALPTRPTIANYVSVLSGGFLVYFRNTVVVAVVSIAIVLVLGVPVAYFVIRSRSGLARAAFRVFLLGLAIPAQAVIIPTFLIISALGLYDSLLAVILPTAAFSLPVCVLILSNAMRNVDEQLYEAMALDGAGPARTLLQLVIPLSRAGLGTVAVFAALQAWNGLLFPLILTQSRDQRLLTLGLYDYVGEYRINIPALLTAVVLSGVPIFVAYLLARRSLISGLVGVSGR